MSWRQRMILVNKEFSWFLISRVIFIAGLRMTPVLLGWKLYDLTGSKLALGILGLAEVIPAILLALPAGVRVDKSNKHRLLSICMLAYLFLMLGMLFVTSKWSVELFSLSQIKWGI